MGIIDTRGMKPSVVVQRIESNYKVKRLKFGQLEIPTNKIYSVIVHPITISMFGLVIWIVIYYNIILTDFTYVIDTTESKAIQIVRFTLRQNFSYSIFGFLSMGYFKKLFDRYTNKLKISNEF